MRSLFTIEKPCTEKLENMSNIQGGKFCNTCHKEVIDFSEWDYHEINEFLLENRDKKICGMFFKTKRKNIIENNPTAIKAAQRNNTFYKVAAGFALTASMMNSYSAQKTTIQKKETTVTSNSQKQVAKTKTPNNSTTENGFYIISGQLISNNKNTPLKGEVSIITITKVYTAKTDENGFYHLEIPKEILKSDNLLEFTPHNYAYDRKLIVYNIKDLGKKQTIKLEYNHLDAMMGEIYTGPPPATEKSLVLVEGKKLDYKIYNKSYWLYSTKYDVHYIPKELLSFFTTKDTYHDMYIVFLN